MSQDVNQFISPSFSEREPRLCIYYIIGSTVHLYYHNHHTLFQPADLHCSREN